MRASRRSRTVAPRHAAVVSPNFLLFDIGLFSHVYSFT
jgi:hypothetical protein